MDEGYLRPEQFLFGAVTSVLLGLLMEAAFRPIETQGGVTMADYSIAPKEIVGYSEGELANALELMESSMDMGQKARISICTEALPTEKGLEAAYWGMVAAGYHLSYPTASLVEGIPTTEFVLQKGSPFWPALIPLIIPILTIGLIAFSVTKIEAISKFVIGTILVTVGGLIILAAVLAKPVTKYIERGGRVPYLPSTSKKALAVG